ncbi:MAG: hypothetical protein HYV00_08005 [Deltaproteobacteria bacterium]|nr:hypothetical protein [Deltaproteobacteria bacterium]
MIDELSTHFALASEWFVDWFDCLRQPFSTAEQALKDCASEKDGLRRAFRLWAVSFLIGLVLQLPVYELLNMEWQKAGFLLPNALLLLLIFLATGVAIHLGLRVTRVPSNLVETCLIYAVIFAGHAPFFTLLLYPSLIDRLSLLQTAKMQGTGFWDAMIQMGAQIHLVSLGYRERSVAGVVADAIRWPVGFLYSGAIMVLMQRALAARYNADRYPVFLGISLAIGVFSIFPLVILSLMYGFLLYIAL